MCRRVDNTGGSGLSGYNAHMLFNLLFNGSGNFLVNLLLFLLVAAALVICISIHEFFHAFIANKLGDPTAKSMGRVTLDPRAHLDPTGTLLLLVFGFGWGKPVPFDPRYLKHPKVDSALIALAGPLSNIVLAAALAGLFHGLGVDIFSLVGVFLALLIRYNLILAIFNLIPVHPLDGFKVVNGILPQNLSYQWLQMAPYGIWILLLLIFTGITDSVIIPLLEFSLKLLGF
jgi:Zn-dependent protease